MEKARKFQKSIYFCFTTLAHTSLVAQLVKNLPAMWETWVQFLGWEDPHGKRRGKRSREKLPTPVFWPREFHRLYRLLWSEHQSQGLRCDKVHSSS